MPFIQDPLCAWGCAGMDRQGGLEEGPEWRVQAGTMTSPDWSQSTQKGPQPSQGQSPEAAKPEVRCGNRKSLARLKGRGHTKAQKQQPQKHIYMMWSFAHEEVVTNWGQVK